MLEDACYEGGAVIVTIAGLHRHVDVHAVARLVGEWLRREISPDAIRCRDGLHHPLEGGSIVRRCQRVGITEIDLVLPRAHLVMTRLRADAHVHEGEADVTADVLTVILRRDVHVGRLVLRNHRAVAVIVELENVELDLGAEVHVDATVGRLLDRLLQDPAAVLLEGLPIRILNVTEHPRHTAIDRTPRHDRHGRRIRTKEDVGTDIGPEAAHRTRIDADALTERALQLIRHDRDVLLDAEHIEKSESYKFDILLFHKLEYVFIRIHILHLNIIIGFKYCIT